jgi:hypothetical protein
VGIAQRIVRIDVRSYAEKGENIVRSLLRVG